MLIWVDDRLCGQGRDRLMKELVVELGWPDRIYLSGDISLPSTEAPPDAQEQGHQGQDSVSP
jgi:hypothetical protein